MTFELSANADTFIKCADFAAMRATLTLSSLATTIPGTGVISALGFPINAPGGFYTADPALKANLAGGNVFSGSQSFESSVAFSFDVRRTTSSTSGTAGTSTITAISTGDITDGFGPILVFRVSDTGVSNNIIGNIGFQRAGADDTGDFVVKPQVAGSSTERFRVKSDGSAVFSGPPILPTYTVATVPSAATYARGMIYVSDAAGGSTMAYSNGTNWKRVYDNANIS